MGSYSGYRSQIGFGFETMPGIKVTALKDFRLDIKLPIGLKIERNMVERQVQRGSGSAMKKLLGLIKLSGGLNTELYTRQSGYFYRLLMGAIPTTIAPTDVSLLAATAIVPTMSITIQPTVASKLKLTVAAATAWGTITVTGTDGLGVTISETVAFTANAIKTTIKYFRTVNAGGIITAGFTGGTLAVVGNKNTYTHEFTLSENIPTITVEDSKGGFPFCYWGLGMTSAEIKIPAVEGVAELSVNMIGRNGEPKAFNGSETPAVLNELSDEPFMNWNMRFSIDGAVVGIHSATLTIDRQLKDDTAEIKDGCQEALPRQVRNDHRKISGSFNIQFANATYYNKFIAGTPARIEIYGTNQAAEGAFESVKFELPEIVFEGTDPEVGDAGEIWIDIPFSAFSSLGIDDELKITVVSTQANYS